MTRTHRPDNRGIHQIIQGPHRHYGRCPRCTKIRPMHWISKTSYLCYICMQETGSHPYYPTLAKESRTTPSALIVKKQVPKPQPRQRSKPPERPYVSLEWNPSSFTPRPRKESKKAPRHSRQSVSEQHGTRTDSTGGFEHASSPGADAETLLRWERNRKVVERLQRQAASQTEH